MNIHTFPEIFICPQCCQHLEKMDEKLYCSKCNKNVKVEGRLLDFSELTPKLPLHFAKYNAKLLKLAGEKMLDVPVNWRVKSVLGMIEKISHENGICLEIGGADGPMTPRLELKFSTMLTLDTGKEFLKRIEGKTKKTVCIYGDAHFLPIADGSVDVVVCSEVLEHVVVPTQMLLEIRRILKKDGKVIFSVPDEVSNNRPLNFIKSLYLHWKKRKEMPSDSHINFYNNETLKKLLFRMGFNVISTRSLFVPILESKSLRGFISSMLGVFKPLYVLCCATPMQDPNIYWRSLEDRIMRDSGTIGK